MSAAPEGLDAPCPLPPDAGAVADLLDWLPDAVVVIGPGGRLVWANRRAELLFGRSLADSAGLSATELVHPDDLELALRSMTTVRDKEVGAAIELRLRTASGWRLFELIGTAVSWCGDEVVVLSVRDLTERRRFELAGDDDTRFRSLVQNAAVVTMLVSGDGVVAAVSGALTRLLGHDPELVEGRPLSEIVVEEDRASLAGALARARGGATAATPVTVDVRLCRHDRSASVPFELALVDLLDDPTVAGIVVTAHEVTARVAAEEGLRTTLSMLSATLESTADGILVVDHEGRIASHNSRFAEMWRLPPGVLTTGDDATAIAFVLGQLVRPEAFLAKVEELYAHPEAESSDTLEFLDGRVFERYSQPQRVEGRVVGRVWSFSDVTERRRLETELKRLALRDPLTDLANRPLFAESLEQALARVRRGHRPLAVLFVDLDRFKQVNDSLGHGAGDRLLVEAAARIRAAVRETDQVARFGGDEFAVLCEDLDFETDAADVAARVLDAFEEPFACDDRQFYVGASIGIAVSVSGGETSEALLRDADAAMYRAKEGGRGRFEAFDETMRHLVATRLELESALRKGLLHGELRVHYQPIVDGDTLEVRGFEALVRWQRPGVGLVEPGAFIAIAEETGMVFVLGEWVLREACRTAASWAARWPGRVLGVAVNVSSRQLLQGDIVDVVADALASTGLDPARLTLELTETTLIDDAVGAQRVLHALRQLGVKIALDDFGTGYSSLTYLRTFPIDVIKVDASFVRTIDTERQGRAIVAAVTQLARDLGIEVVAEGVERPSQLDAVLRVGCAAVQGYLFSPPRPPEDVEELVEGPEPAERRAWALGTGTA
ncbi:MAG: EAL domain-containing protein [Acidobacteriota bacterium]|nr:EAL domain-containing protein [Acidobacteriota bacterium]